MPDLGWISVLAPHFYPRWVGYREWSSALRHLQDILRPPTLQASHRGLDGNCPLQCFFCSASSQPGKLTQYPALCRPSRLTTITLCLGVPDYAFLPTVRHLAQSHRNMLWTPARCRGLDRRSRCTGLEM
jgi:hypothetical protein